MEVKSNLHLRMLLSVSPQMMASTKTESCPSATSSCIFPPSSLMLIPERRCSFGSQLDHMSIETTRSLCHLRSHQMTGTKLSLTKTVCIVECHRLAYCAQQEVPSQLEISCHFSKLLFIPAQLQVEKKRCFMMKLAKRVPYCVVDYFPAQMAYKDGKLS